MEAHVWKAHLENGTTLQIARQILCKPITEEEAKEEATKHGKIILVEPIPYSASDFWNAPP